jgi:hypothetical protein
MALTDKEKQEANRRAVLQVREKMKLESVLFKKIKRFLNKQARIVKRDLANGKEFTAEDLAPELRRILEKHYRVVSKKFTPAMLKEINRALRAHDPTIKPIKKDNRELLLLLGLFIKNEVDETVRKMTATSNRQVTRATVKADALIADGKLDLDDRDDFISGRIANQTNGRAGTVAVTETQKAAEGTKFTISKGARDGIADNAVLFGGAIGVAAVVITKRWITMGDSIVRAMHRAAAFQEQKTIELLRFKSRRRKIRLSLAAICSCSRETLRWALILKILSTVAVLPNTELRSYNRRQT